MNEICWIVYAIFGAISYIAFAVMDLKTFGMIKVSDLVLNAIFAVIWPVIWVIFLGLLLGYAITNKVRKSKE